MANALRHSADPHASTPVADDWSAVNPFFDSSATRAAFDAVLSAQRQQWEMLETWQKTLGEWQQDAWDQWVSHWGGGVPIDA